MASKSEPPSSPTPILDALHESTAPAPGPRAVCALALAVLLGSSTPGCSGSNDPVPGLESHSGAGGGASSASAGGGTQASSGSADNGGLAGASAWGGAGTSATAGSGGGRLSDGQNGGAAGLAGVRAAGGEQASEYGVGGAAGRLGGSGGNSSGGAGGADGATSVGGSRSMGGASSARGGAGRADGGVPGNGGDSGGAGSLANITIWIAGDSTVANGSTPCPVGWGALFASHFSNKVTVRNSAIGGRSVWTWLYNVQSTMDESTGECVLAKDSSGKPTVSAGWQTMLDGMKSGDYLFIQFGINDGSTTCPRHVGLDAFKTAYGMMAQAAKDHGAHPVFLTPVSAIGCNGSTARATRGSYVTATQEAGKQYDVPVIDLHDLSIKLYNERGFCPIPGGDVSATTTGPVGDFFCEDHTHFERAGATAIAQLVADAVRSQKLGLASYLQ